VILLSEFDRLSVVRDLFPNATPLISASKHWYTDDFQQSDNNVTLLQRLQNKTDLRNTDRTRLTSLSWAAIEGSLEVFEWLLLDYGHDDQELSRVSSRSYFSLVNSLRLGTLFRIQTTTPSSTYSPQPPHTSYAQPLPFPCVLARTPSRKESQFPSE